MRTPAHSPLPTMPPSIPLSPRSITHHVADRRFVKLPPRDFVVESVAHMIAKNCGDALLVCQPTGIGMSTVAQLCATILTGIVLVVTPTLSLNADQAGKIRNFDEKDTYVFNLDDHRHSNEAMENALEIMKLLHHSHLRSRSDGSGPVAHHANNAKEMSFSIR